MNHLSNNQLKTELKNLVGKEREILHKILLHLREVDRRKLFSAEGYPSLRNFAMNELNYSEDQAERRIAAMRLLKDIPEAEAKIKDGSLTLSTLAQAQWHFKRNDFSKSEKLEVLKKLENATKKQTRAILHNDDKTRYSFAADSSFEKLIEDLRALHPHLSFDDLNKKVWELAYEKLHPNAKIERAEKRLEKTQTRAGRVFTDKQSDEREARAERSRFISAELKRAVWRKYEGKCALCKSVYALEYDHILPFAKGGLSIESNLRLLCRNCNHLKAIEHYGIRKMDQYLRSPCGKYFH